MIVGCDEQGKRFSGKLNRLVQDGAERGQKSRSTEHEVRA